jgi:hypothetical protein
VIGKQKTPKKVKEEASAGSQGEINDDNQSNSSPEH